MKHLRRFNESEENFSHEEENTLDLESKIIDIIKNETYTRDVKYTDDQEVDPESIRDAAKSILSLLKKEGYIK
jgi:ribosomal protein S8